jgi:hypothetical protein
MSGRSGQRWGFLSFRTEVGLFVVPDTGGAFCRSGHRWGFLSFRTEVGLFVFISGVKARIQAGKRGFFSKICRLTMGLTQPPIQCVL